MIPGSKYTGSREYCAVRAERKGHMKIRCKIGKTNFIGAAICLGIGIVMMILTRINVLALIGFPIGFLLVSSLQIELKKEIPWLWTAILFLGGAVFTELCMQITILDPSFFIRTGFDKHVLNVLLVMSIYYLIHAIINNTSRAAILSHVILEAFAYVNYFVYLFRENEFSYVDFASMDTGFSVLGSYRLSLHNRGAYVIMLSVLFITFLCKLHITYQKKARVRIIDLVAALALFGIVWFSSQSIETQTWEQKGSYRNGYALNFMLGIRDSYIGAPEDYSEEKIKELEETYGTAGNENPNVSANEEVQKPTIIAIMDESFADLSVIGDLQTNQEVMPFISSMQDNTIKGYALSSVFGAKTPNSEWEFMTGNSMAFLPSGSVVYEQYLKSEPTSIVSTLKNEGYTAVAMHPYFSTGWKRKTNYPKFGFDEMYFMDDNYFDQNNIMRTYITDQEMFNKIIDRFNARQEGENLFLMGITMQNHGGYKDWYANFNEDVATTNTMYYNDVNQYLSLAHQTDIAVQNLITYFQGVDEPVEIIFFGDHQPSLNSSFYYELNGKGMSGLTEDELENFYKVPFFIWTNYDSQSVDMEITSLNYLSTLALERANIDLPPYNQFLAQMMQEIPAINSRGYFSKSTGGFQYIENAEGEEAEWLSDYETLQYNSMFDKKNRSEVFFPYITEQ